MSTDPYPTQAELRRLRSTAQPLVRRRSDALDGADLAVLYSGDGCVDVVRAVRDLWWNPEWGIRRAVRRHRSFGKWVRRWEISTGGWSGNEDVIATLEGTWWWTICWVSSRRGGHYVFEVPEP